LAEYGIQATQLSAPTGAGSAPVGAVETPGSRILDVITTVADVFSKNMAATRKEEAAKREGAVVSGYVKAETNINNAMASGQMSAEKAAAMSRANFNKHAAGYSEYIDRFEKAGKALKGFTEMGEAEEQLKTEKARRESNKTLAINRGFSFYNGMSKEAEDSQVESALASVRVEQQLAAQYKASSENRAQAGFDATVQALEDKKSAFNGINMVASSNISSFQLLSKDLGDQVRSGKMTPEMGKQLLNERYSNISAAIVSSARLHPELASSYTKVFSDINALGVQMMDPANDVKGLEDQLKKRILQGKLIATQDPETLAGVVTNQLFENSPSIAASLSSTASKTLTRLSTLPAGTQEYAPQVIGNDEVEGDVLKGLKQGLKDIQSGNTTDKQKAIDQNSNSVNHLLTQAGEVMNQTGASPKKLAKIAEFIATTEYATLVKHGKISPQAAGAAGQAFQIIYAPVIAEGLQQRLAKELPRKTVEVGVPSVVKGAATKLGDIVDIKFTGSGIMFEPKIKVGMSRTEVMEAGSSIETLRSSQAAINQLIHISAHLKGETDYAKHWEENKHNWIPSVFPDPSKLKPGTVVDGYKYNGGAYNDRASWIKQ